MNNTTLLPILLIVVLVVYVIQFYYPRKENDKIRQIKERIKLLDPNFARIPIYIDDSAYTIDKHTIFICLKDLETGQIFDINTLMYVTLHELAHVKTRVKEENEHGPIFKQNFLKLLRDANSIGIYDPSRPLPTSYCGAKR